MLLSLCRCQLRYIHHASINIATYVLGGRRRHGIWRIRWSPTRYQRRLWLMHCVIRKDGWMLMNWGKLRWINNWIIQWRRHRHNQWWEIIALLVTILSIKAPVITSVATTNNLWTWHDECNMSMRWCCVHVILFVDVHQKVGSIFFSRQLQSCLSFSTRNKIDYDHFVSL